MFESLRAAKAAKLTLGNVKGPSGSPGNREWSCSLLFFGAIVGSASGSEIDRKFTLVLNKGLQEQIIENLVKHGFTLDLTNIPKNAIQPINTSNFMRLAIAQIADEMDIVKELREVAAKSTLVVFNSAPGKVKVFPYVYTPEVKKGLIGSYGESEIEILNETIKGL
ncbi:hypothetical protein LCG56_28535 (plasmid) [Pseudomonas cannabina pv. alisalensis]|uniref:Uncharacterized protein n=1 Tax=Pseudomonas syringae pv. maculicola str. ES4326 TaxID=629265 RepID=A0A8T8CBT9_PSEYM|nr:MULTISPECIES: hypothetical protein [Pseudomonas syringae group]QHF00707.1 hypothetical protein PMA4326_029905 [Pseudomonas syringae pv. maculicola str. ES4326]UBZ00317.1 hypothetical protein LCG56_28535 [Pseudomonas cannabina pv. alisalensis]